MKKLFGLLFLIFTLSLIAKIGGLPPLQGYISSIEKKDSLLMVKITVKDVPINEVKNKVKPGMSIRLIHSIGGANFRIPIGKVLSIENGIVIGAIEENLLNKEIENPYTNEKIKVSQLFSVGAEVSLSDERL